MSSLKFTVEIEPVAKQRARVTRFGTYTPKETVKYENALRDLSRAFAPPSPYNVPIVVRMRFFVSRPKKTKFWVPAVRPDLDNYVKAVKDALNGVIWTDDGRITRIEAEKLYATERKPGVEIEVEEARK